MKYFILLVATIILIIILKLLGIDDKSEMKVSGGFLVLNVILTILGFIKAAELLGRYLE